MTARPWCKPAVYYIGQGASGPRRRRHHPGKGTLPPVRSEEGQWGSVPEGNCQLIKDLVIWVVCPEAQLYVKLPALGCRE